MQLTTPFLKDVPKDKHKTVISSIVLGLWDSHRQWIQTINDSGNPFRLSAQNELHEAIDFAQEAMDLNLLLPGPMYWGIATRLAQIHVPTVRATMRWKDRSSKL